MKSIRFLFVRTDSLTVPRSVSPPLGILYLAAALRESQSHSFDIKVLDLRLHRRPFWALSRMLVEFRPEIVGLSTLTFEAPEMHQAAEMVKRRLPGCPVVVGGPHGTNYYSDILQDPNIDYVVVGEGERTLMELSAYLAERDSPPSLPGLARRDNGQVSLPGPRPPIENLDDLPHPAWDLIEIGAYGRFNDMNRSMGKGKYMALFTSRACPFGCIYCHSIFGKKFRAHSPENVLEEIRILRSKFGVKEFQFFDDSFNFDLDRAKKIGELIINDSPGCAFSFPNGVRADMVDREFLKIFRRAGAYTITFAVETASPRLQKLIKKHLNLEKARKAIGEADRLGYLTQGFFMLGFPTETREELEATVDFAMDSPLVAATFFTIVPFRGTELYKMVGGDSQGLDYRSHQYYVGKERSRANELGIDLNRFQKKAYARFYSNPVRFWKGIIRCPNPWGFVVKNLLRGGWIIYFR